MRPRTGTASILVSERNGEGRRSRTEEGVVAVGDEDWEPGGQGDECGERVWAMVMVSVRKHNRNGLHLHEMLAITSASFVVALPARSGVGLLHTGRVRGHLRPLGGSGRQRALQLLRRCAHAVWRRRWMVRNLAQLHFQKINSRHSNDVYLITSH